MRKALLVVAVVVASAAAALGLVKRGRAPGEAHAAAAEAQEPLAAATTHDDEIHRLRDQLRAKDRVINELASQALPRAAPSADPAPPPPSPAAPDLTARACETLDERLAAAPPNPALAAELRRTLGDTEPAASAKADLASLACAGALCKVAVTAETDGAVEAYVAAMTARLPASFAATVVYATRDGERSVYVARARAELEVAP